MKSTMTLMVVAGLLLVGCGFGGGGDDISSIIGRIGALEHRIGELEYALMKVSTTPGPRGPVGPAGPPGDVKSLRLVMLNGQDLGLSMGGYCYWNGSIDARSCLFSSFEKENIRWTSPDCTGQKYMKSGPYMESHSFYGTGDNWFKPFGQTVNIAASSAIDYRGQCYPAQEAMDATPIYDTGVRIPDVPKDFLKIELR